MLPAAVSSVPAVAIPSSTATPATPSATSSSATAKTPAPSPAATASAFARRPGFIDDNVSAHEIVAVESLNGALGFLVAVHLDEPEPARLPRKTVAHQRDVRRGDSRLRK